MERTKPVINENRLASYSSTVASVGIRSSYWLPKDPLGRGAGLPVTRIFACAQLEPVGPVIVMV